MTPSQPSPYYATRYVADAHRATVWRHVCRYLARWIPESSDILELGAGYCDFSNAIRGRSRTAMDIDPSLPGHAAEGVRTEIGDCSDLSRFEDGSFDVVFASNLLEHLEREAAVRLLHGARRVLRPGGRVVLIQPNFRLRPHEYFDDYTHITVYSDRSLPDFLASVGFEPVAIRARFLPLTMKSRFSTLTALVPLYLRSPIKPFAGQMLVVGVR